jgi:XRE family transcriptional regulator, aerobic/anaerobic benzoate catabolism transcriptional regulator
MTVKDLAASSGLSERFLVSLEGGHANPSVRSVVELAAALRSSLGALLPDEPAEPVAPDREHRKPSRLVVLVGLRGAGKSSVGAQAASRLGVDFVELDERVRARAGLSAGEIFDQHGAAYYRRLERAELERLLDEGIDAVVATGGGLVTDHASYERLLAGATVIWLAASPEDHLARVLAQGDTRPMANRSDAMRELRGILRARRALYERAHHTIDTTKLGLGRSIERAVKLSRGAFEPPRGGDARERGLRAQPHALRLASAGSAGG